jgi:hypothetical protein
METVKWHEKSCEMAARWQVLWQSKNFKNFSRKILDYFNFRLERMHLTTLAGVCWTWSIWLF